MGKALRLRILASCESRNRGCAACVGFGRKGFTQEPIMRDEEGRKVETAVEARAGFRDRPVLLVLCASVALAVVVLAVLWFGYFAGGA
jgi:hypothetical protein